MYKLAKQITTALALSSVIATSASASSSRDAHYEVTITNLTYSINLTPIIVAVHPAGEAILKLGHPASDALTQLAEGGDTMPLQTLLHNRMKTVDIKTTGGLLGPGESVTIALKTKGHANRISLASMMLPTNDGFVALNSRYAPTKPYGVRTYYSPAYDAGTEPNDEMCTSIPGPTCGGAGPSPEISGEGYVHIHRGIHGIGDLAADVYDWRNPAMRVRIKRIPPKHR